MDVTTYHTYLQILREELVCALGCTEPIAVAYVAALARTALGREPEHLEVTCSGNIVKNVKSVTVPNSGGQHGIEVAATLGAIGGDETRALEVLEALTDTDRDRCRDLVAQGYCDVSLADGVPNLYVRVVAQARGHEAVACVAGRHTNVVELSFDGMPTPLPRRQPKTTPTYAQNSTSPKSGPLPRMQTSKTFVNSSRARSTSTRPLQPKAFRADGAPTLGARSSKRDPTTWRAVPALLPPPAPTHA